MAMEMVESIIRTGSLRRRDRSGSRGPTDGISFSKPLRAMSLRSSSVPLQLRTKTDTRPTSSTIQFQGIPGMDALPNLDELSPLSYDELYASCDAMSSKSSVTDVAKEPEEPASPSSVEEQEEKQEDPTEASSTVSSDPGTLPGLQPSLPSAVALAQPANIVFS